MSPARIVAITNLTLDVHADLEKGPALDHGSAEGAFYRFLNRHRIELQAIHAAAVKEMNELALPRLAEIYPAPG